MKLLVGAIGSSPRARGTHVRMQAEFLEFRFIPACAGNTSDRGADSRRRPVHPRVRGEHLISMGDTEDHAGSSPRARGTPDAEGFRAAVLRFIPACAGNTMRQPDRPLSLAVHPRVRGEHMKILGAPTIEVGSSPRARGTRLLAHATGNLDRFIPACAGNTPPPYRRALCFAVHPRVRGEHED